jgi:rare lipoprotein A
LGFSVKLRFASRAALISCVGFIALAGSAFAQRAPIVYAGQGASSSASRDVASLEGGGERSYGYGQNTQARRGAVIDLRRAGSTAPRAPVVFEQTADVEDEADEAPVEAPAPVAAPAAPTAGEGAQPWLERERVGPPYEANGRWYVPTPEPGYAQTGMASWYGPQFHGQRTASGEVFDQEALTAAHPTLPIPSLVQVTNLENGREVIVRVNDRGPFVGERLIDMSRGAAEALGFEQAGHARVHVRYLGPAPRRVNADGSEAPASPPSPAPALAPASAPQEEGPRSLLPPAPASGTELAGAPVEEPVRSAPQPVYAAASGSYFVQVGAYSDPTNAHRVRDVVGAAGPVVVDVRQTASGELFRVRVGPWASREEADAARQTLASLGYGESIVAAR